MTNGEKLQETFPNGVLTSINNSYYWGDDILVSKNWWNAEYKEPTTKNNLGVDKADYENRLKADMMAMLTEIQLEIEEKDADLRYCGHNLMAVDCIDIIQQKIDALKKGVENGKA